MVFSLTEINEIFGLINWNNSEKNNLNFGSIGIDSRSISSSDLFVAIKGKKFDGHDFIKEVFEKGIRAVVVMAGASYKLPDKLPYWIVPDTLEAFQKLALLKRRKLNLPVVAITGSVGKTTTKEMIGEILRNLGNINKSEANKNNEIGVGLTIISSEDEHKALVLEMGMRGLGQIENLSKFSEPNIAVITNIGCSHIGLLGSKKNIAIAKCEIAKYLHPNGLVIIPHGDTLLDKTLKEIWFGRIVRVKLTTSLKTFSLNEETNDLILGYYDLNRNSIEVEDKSFNISLNGSHNALNFLFAYAVSKEFCITFNKSNVFKFNTLNGRNNIIKTEKITIFDETYNASPESVKACLEVLIQQKGNKFVVLGSMKELGEFTIKLHKEILSYIYSSPIKGCIFLNEFDSNIFLENSKNLQDKIYFVNNKDVISKIVNKWISKGDKLLIKGSRYWELEKIIPLID